MVGFLKGKSAIQIARKFGARQKNFTGEHFWARGYLVSTVELDEDMAGASIRNQEDEDGQLCCIVPKKHVAVAPRMHGGPSETSAIELQR